ncbi:flavodoxin family protein [Dialister sp.]|uniref:flavodoxin family protein n=1 Tax=Dialister sp. TaxID=1955814 RepID=UPI003F0D93BD
MSKKILVCCASFRKGSNSEKLGDAFIRGAREAGHEVRKLRLAEKTIHFCRGCLSCQQTGKCVIRDDMEPILALLKEADVLALTTPIYYYEMSGLLKTFLDRVNPLYVSSYAFRDVYLFTSGAEENIHTSEHAEAGLQGWIDCFSDARFAGSIFAGGVTDEGDISHREDVLKEAYEMGKTC